MKGQFEVLVIEDGVMTLKINRTTGCHSCAASSGCGSAILNNYSIFKKPANTGVVAGDFVTLEVPDSELFLKAFMFYIFPILMLFVGSYLGKDLFPETEIWQIIFGISALLGSIFLTKYLTNKRFILF
jgi:sigma-E factor negative regulatory protein RseC